VVLSVKLFEEIEGLEKPEWKCDPVCAFRQCFVRRFCRFHSRGTGHAREAFREKGGTAKMHDHAASRFISKIARRALLCI
jgi:hypothetical protein